MVFQWCLRTKLLVRLKSGFVFPPVFGLALRPPIASAVPSTNSSTSFLSLGDRGSRAQDYPVSVAHEREASGQNGFVVEAVEMLGGRDIARLLSRHLALESRLQSFGHAQHGVPPLRDADDLGAEQQHLRR